MKLVLVSLSVSVCTIICYVFAANANHIPINRIVGGSITMIEMYPYMASLRFGAKPFCGGSIITSNLVLSAAHCLKLAIKSKGEPNVVVGETIVTEWSDYYRVQEMFIHAQFNEIDFRSDIGIVKIFGRFTFSERVQPIALAVGEVPVGSLASIAGWGQSVQKLGDFNKQMAHLIVLQAAQIPIVSRSTCQNAYSSVAPISDKQICAGYTSGGIDTCQGDSGGPLTYQSIQIGVVSFGKGCADGKYPGIYTKVSEYIDWIEKFID